MKIALVNPINKNKKGAMNKDLAGGLGTFSSFGNTFISKLISAYKKKNVKIPLLTFANLNAIFKLKGYDVDYFEEQELNNNKEYDIILIYGSIVDFKNENRICRIIKKNQPKAKVGFFGPFTGIQPDLFKTGDFIIDGEAESYFLYEFNNLNNIKGKIKVNKVLDLNDLPTPDFTGFDVKSYSYKPAIKEKPFLVLQASKGCPYSCSYYCAYGKIQGSKYRLRSAKKIVEDIVKLQANYGIKGLQFRDPTFGLDKTWLNEFIYLMNTRKVKIKYGIETRMDLLNEDILTELFKTGLRNINVGIETINEDISKKNKRLLINKEHQERIIHFCNKIGIKISAFYIFGMKGDTKESIVNVINYAIKLNTNVAQFCISIPYPGTEYYLEMKKNNKLVEKDFEKYNSAELVFKHDKLTKDELLKLKEYAFRKYYFRITYLINLIKWKIKEFY